jgi:hypothetical protein
VHLNAFFLLINPLVSNAYVKVCCLQKHSTDDYVKRKFHSVGNIFQSIDTGEAYLLIPEQEIPFFEKDFQ